MDRNEEYFKDRLPEGKETFTRDEVAGHLRSEAEFSTRTANKNMVAKSDYDILQTELNETKEALTPYKNKEFNDNVNNEFTKLNGNSKRTQDLIKLSGITKEDTKEVILEKIAKTKQSNNYDFLFNEKENNSIKESGHKTQGIKEKVVSQEFRVFGGSNKLFNLFKSKK